MTLLHLSKWSRKNLLLDGAKLSWIITNFGSYSPHLDFSSNQRPLNLHQMRVTKLSTGDTQSYSNLGLTTSKIQTFLPLTLKRLLQHFLERQEVGQHFLPLFDLLLADEQNKNREVINNKITVKARAWGWMLRTCKQMLRSLCTHESRLSSMDSWIIALNPGDAKLYWYCLIVYK